MGKQCKGPGRQGLSGLTLTLNMKRWPTVLNRASPLLSERATAKVKGEAL